MVTAVKEERARTPTEREITRMEGQGGNVDILGIVKSKVKGNGNEVLIRLAILNIYKPEHIRTFYKQYVNMLSKSEKKWLAIKEANRTISQILNIDYEPSEGMTHSIPRSLWVKCMTEGDLSISRR
ncbi:MAG: hypothetical protein ABSA33_01495 [Candidatus Micrarchaeaceae archaeon]|jgi:hypothetical protein